MTTEAQRAQSNTKKYLVLLIVVSVLVVKSSAQLTFQKTFGDTLVNDNGYSLIQVSDGGFLIAGTQFNGGNAFESLFLIRTDGAGDTLWTKRIREPALDYSAGTVIQTYDGGFAAAGVKGSLNGAVPYLVKMDSTGSLMWNKSYLWFAQERIHDVVQMQDSGFLLAGTYYNLLNELAYFIRTDLNGDTLWTASFGETGFNIDIYSLAKTSDSAIIASGSIQSTTTQDVDAFLMKIDPTGNLIWAKGYGGALYDYAQHVETTFDGGCIVAAVTYSFGYADYWLLRTDSQGNLMWSRTFGGGSDDRSESVKQLPDGGFLVCGESSSFSAGNFDSYLVRTDAQGDSVWTKVLDKTFNNEAYGLTLTADGGFALTGPSTNANGNTDILFVKSDSTGFMGCPSAPVNSISINTSLAVTTNHNLSFLPTQPSVFSYALTELTSCSEKLICQDNHIGSNEKAVEFIVAPNPAIDKIRIKGSRLLSVAEAKIFRLDGMHEMEIKRFEFTDEIDVSELAPGFHFLELRTTDFLFRTHFIKQ